VGGKESRTGKDSCADTDRMGASVSWLSGMLWAKKEIRILILGLVCFPFCSACFLLGTFHLFKCELQDNAGKTTLLYRLKVHHPFSSGYTGYILILDE